MMGKSDAEVIALFNQQVNMTADELETWLDDPQSCKAGTGVGIESGRRIVQILRKNPTKNPDAYDEEDFAHIRKVVGYNSRHLAQEDHLKKTKTTAELAKTKSTISLRNWGHDPVKVKLQWEAETSSKNDARGSGGGGGGEGDDGGVKNTNAAPDHERDHDEDSDGGRDREHDEDEGADGEKDTQASNSGTESESDAFEDAETGRKRAPRGPPAGTQRRRGGRRHARGDGDDVTGVGQNKRQHRDEEPDEKC